jgi:hypothetical protein
MLITRKPLVFFYEISFFDVSYPILGSIQKYLNRKDVMVETYNSAL